jgi:hypothetical protein
MNYHFISHIAEKNIGKDMFGALVELFQNFYFSIEAPTKVAFSSS